MALLKSVVLATYGFTSALASASAVAGHDEETTLLQLSRKSDLSQHSEHTGSFFPKLSHLNDPHTRKSALLEVQKTAIHLASMDRTEATPLVIEVCTETAQMLNSTVLYAIIEEDAADRAALQEAYDGFEQWEAQRQEAEEALLAAAAVVSQRAMAFANCRTIEIETCVNETICTEHEFEDCEERDRLERELQEIDEEIHSSWCLNGEVRTSTDFRTTTVEVFHRYTEKLSELERANHDCEWTETHCETTLQTWIETHTMCAVKQAEMQTASCEYHHVAGGALIAYQEGFQAALAFYNDVVARVMIAEADRKVEWDVLTRVICLLLSLTNEENGVVSSDETAARIQRCWDDEVDVSHLDIDYLDPPDMLALPELPPLPCTVEYDQRYNTGPPVECTALMETHQLHINSECSCLADEIAEQGLILGHYLLADPGVPMAVVEGVSWSVQYEGATYGGALSPSFSEDFSALSQQMLTPDQLDDDGSGGYTGPIASIAWAYPSSAANFEGSMCMVQRFIFKGGLVFLNTAGEVIEIRELVSSSGPLGQPISATLSFSSAEEITDEQAAAVCPSMHPVQQRSRHYSQGAREYCWVMGDNAIPTLPQCVHGCFVYNMVYGKVIFPVIEGLHIMSD